MNLFRNRFVQSVGVAAIIYLTFQGFAWLTDAIAHFAIWFRVYALPWAEETALALGFIFLLVSAVLNSKNSDF